MEGKLEPVKIAVSDTIPVSGAAGAKASTQASIGPSAPTGLRVEVSSDEVSSDSIPDDPLGTHSVRIKDPLSEVTRRERKTFLGVSILAIAVIKANLIPNKIAAFGIEIDHVKHQELVTLLFVVVGYFLLVFIAYAYSDFLGWRIAILEASRVRTIEREKIDREVPGGVDNDSPEVAEIYRRQSALSAKAIPTSALRAFLDFLLPIFVGVIALIILFLAWRG